MEISLPPSQDDGPQEEWEDWDTMTITVVPNNPPTDEESGDPRMKYSTRLASSSTENEPSAEELFHDMQPVYKKAKMVNCMCAHVHVCVCTMFIHHDVYNGSPRKCTQT